MTYTWLGNQTLIYWLLFAVLSVLLIAGVGFFFYILIHPEFEGQRTNRVLRNFFKSIRNPFPTPSAPQIRVNPYGYIEFRSGLFLGTFLLALLIALIAIYIRVESDTPWYGSAVFLMLAEEWYFSLLLFPALLSFFFLQYTDDFFWVFIFPWLVYLSIAAVGIFVKNRVIFGLFYGMFIILLIVNIVIAAKFVADVIIAVL